MHSLRLAGVPPVPPSFKRHRFDSDPSRFSLNLSLSKPIPTPNWASLPSPPMSGSPPPDHLVDSLQRQGRRRKRSDTPDTQATSLGSTPAVIAAPVFANTSEESHRDVVAATTAVSIQPATWPTSYPAPPSQIFGGGAPFSSSSATLTFQPPFPARPGSPKSTRKSKVHVPSACVNCKNKHLRCDNSRPCQRCVQSAKEESCVDVQHKKRGRPPLKHDSHAPSRPSVSDASAADARRSRDNLTGPPRPPPQLYPNLYTIAPQEILQSPDPRQREAPRPQTRLGPSAMGMYASPSTSSTYATASGMTYYGSGHRPSSSSSSIQTSQPPSPYYHTPSAGTSPEAGLFTRPNVYGTTLARQIPTSEPYPPTNTSAFRPTLYPRPSTEAPSYTAPAGLYYRPQQSISSELQLPPILPAPLGSHTDPAMAQQQRLRQTEQQQQQHQQRGRETGTAAHPGDNNNTIMRRPDAKRPRMSLGDIVHPRNEWPRTEG